MSVSWLTFPPSSIAAGVAKAQLPAIWICPAARLIVLVFPPTMEPCMRTEVNGEAIPPMPGTWPARALLRVRVTPCRTGSVPLLLATPIPPPLAAELPVIVDSVIETATSPVAPST